MAVADDNIDVKIATLTGTLTSTGKFFVCGHCAWTAQMVRIWRLTKLTVIHLHK